MHGIVIQTHGAACIVRTDDGQAVECRVKGTFRLRGLRSTNPVAVGDGVTLKPAPDGQPAFITALDERRNYIVRRASNLSKQSHILAANIDLVLLLATTARPLTTTTFIDRFLASAQAYRVPVAIVANKADDLRNSEERSYFQAIKETYSAIGYPVIETSALTGQGLEEIVALVAGKITLLAGHSGAGKSTLLNSLIPEAGARTADVSLAHGTGTHTTTHSQLYELPQGGSLIDIPGIKGFGTFNITPAEVSHYFTDIFALSPDCRFANCTHTHEPGCAVREALQQGKLAPTRYASYLSMLSDFDEGKYRAPQ